MRVLTAMLMLAPIFLTGCTMIDRYVGEDAPPGGYVSGTSPFARTMMDLNPFPSGYNTVWTRIRVIAPPGASVCRIADQSIFVPKGPEPEGKPNEKREVMLTYHGEAKTAAFECKAPTGAMKRTVRAVPYDIVLGGGSRPERVLTTAQVKSPLVHIDPSDPEAEARWSAISAELCPEVSERASTLICKPGMLEKLKAADLYPDR